MPFGVPAGGRGDTYTWFSPLGENTQAKTHRAVMTRRPTRMLHLRFSQSLDSRAQRHRDGNGGRGGEGKRRGLRRTRWPCWVLLGLVDLVMQAKGGETVSSGRNLCEVVMMRRFRGSLAGRTRSSFGRRYFVQANVRKLGSWNAKALANNSRSSESLVIFSGISILPKLQLTSN